MGLKLNKVDSFLGYTTTTHRGGELTVVSRLGATYKYVVTCSVCSLDTELFPLGSIQSIKHNLLRGAIPCGCGNSVRWSEEQSRVLCSRVCASRGASLEEFIGDFTGSQTRCRVYLFDYGVETTKLKVYQLIGLKEGQAIPYNLSLEDRMKSILTYKGFNNTECFKEVTSSIEGYTRTKLQYTCRICTEDEYTKSGLCTGVFTTTYSDAKRNGVNCRCCEGYRFTAEQREFQVKNKLKLIGGSFKGWVDSTRSPKGKFNWLCENKHKNSTSLNNFLYGDRGCGGCVLPTGNGTGYYVERKDEEDNLYVLMVKDKTEQYLKVGRTFQLKVRLRNIETSNKVKVSLLALFKGSHEEVYKAEQGLVGVGSPLLKYNPKGVCWSNELLGNSNLNFVLQELSETCLVQENEVGQWDYALTNKGVGKEGNSFEYDANKCKYYTDKQLEVFNR